MATVAQEIDEVRRHMAQIRRELHEDVRGVVEGAEAATDWRRYVRNYPWAITGAALVVGYLIIPRKQKPTTIEIHSGTSAPAAPQKAVESPKAIKVEKERKSLLMMGLGMIAPVALRAAQGYALKYAEQWLAQKMANGPMGNFQDLAAAFAAHQQQASSPPSSYPGSGGLPPSGPRF